MNTDLGPIDQRLRRSVEPADKEDDEVLLARIDDALARLEAGSFGYCARCGEKIAIPRLVQDPAARHCGACDRD